MTPTEASTPVSLETWQTGPYNRYTIGRMREVVPTARVAAGDAPLALPEGPRLDLDAVPLTLRDGTPTTAAAVLDASYTDGFLVLADGVVRYESYPGDLEADRTHMLYSVSKSIVSSVAANLVAAGLLDTEALVTAYVPEFATSGYAGATVRHLLDMRSGIRFSEEYLDPHAEVRQLDQAMGWTPRIDDWVPSTLYGYLPHLRATRDHGGWFDYRSCETDALGWVCERAAGLRMPELLSRTVWSRIARHDMDAGVDKAGSVLHDGGFAATLRDLARFGEALRRAGTPDGGAGTADGAPLVPASWIEDSLTGAPDSRQAFADSPLGTYRPGFMYRNQFWVPPAEKRVLRCIGIHGQLVYIDFARRAVVVKLSSWPTPLDDALDAATTLAVETIIASTV